MRASSTHSGDHLFLIAEELAQDFSLFPHSDHLQQAKTPIGGLLSDEVIRQEAAILKDLDVDSYVTRCIEPASDVKRASAKVVLEQLCENVSEVVEVGPFYSVVATMQWGSQRRRIGVIAQERGANQGAWMPEHHHLATKRAIVFGRRSLPILTLMDTPGATADAEANYNNQSHSISMLIAQMCNVEVPTVGITLGFGYSGGAIPLAASNVILSVRDGVFNTIQPQGLASIARKYNLSWQECARHVGVSAYELYEQGNIDGVIDYVPGEPGEKLDNLRQAIITSIVVIEQNLSRFIHEHHYIKDHYEAELQRYLQRTNVVQQLSDDSTALAAPDTDQTNGRAADDIEAKSGETEALVAARSAWVVDALLHANTPPVNFPNIFGVAVRYLRYLGIRRRIISTTKQQYGRLAKQEVPKGELHARAQQEVVAFFEDWLQNPDRVIYDDTLSQAVRNYHNKRQAAGADRSQFARLLLGEPKEQYKLARTQLLMGVALYLYNRWKGRAHDNFDRLIGYLRHHTENRYLVRVDDLQDSREIIRLLLEAASDRYTYLGEQISFEAKRLFRAYMNGDVSESVAKRHLAMEFNRLIREDALTDEAFMQEIYARAERRAKRRVPDNQFAHRRWVLEKSFPDLIRSRTADYKDMPESEVTCLDLIQSDDLRQNFIETCHQVLAFGKIYDYILGHLNQVAHEADKTGSVSAESMGKLLSEAYGAITFSQPKILEESNKEKEEFIQDFKRWCDQFLQLSKRYDFLQSVAEWKQTETPHLSDTLFVVVTFLFLNLIPDYLLSLTGKKKYTGTIRPKRIGRRKDFWNRLRLAYRDLQIQDLLNLQKRKYPMQPQDFIERFFTQYEPLNDDLLSSDPVTFPGFRLAVETALNNDKIPCGVVTGIGQFKGQNGPVKVGTIISNIAFQAGAFDMASAEKFCALLVACARQNLPVVCFISSGGMQTKEGAGALFSMAAVNDRLTRFVSEFNLPVMMFGFGDCAGGAQASFVTHPLVHTCYFSGTNMPFAGQIVVPSYLPSSTTLSNYLALVPGAMSDLVRHPFLPNQDKQLTQIDPEIPLPTRDIEDVVEHVLKKRNLHSGQLTVTTATKPNKQVERKPVRKTMVHARGCTATKLIRVAQRNDIAIVLVQSDPDMQSVAVDQLGENDRVVCIGGNTPDESYLNGLSVVRIAESERVDSLHPGIGFLAENAQFAELCQKHGINFIGPSAESMIFMGNKSNAISTAVRLSIPVVSGSHGILTSLDLASSLAEKIGYPVVIKAVHGGGGKGIQVVERAEDFATLFYQVQAEAKGAFGNSDIYLEKFVQSLRHIEVQLLRDTHGRTLVLGLRDCSVQRNKQKIIEESGSTMLPEALEEAVYNYAKAIANEIDYHGAGTVEFVYDLKANAVYFMEMNTRLQVEHAVTEAVYGVDLVKAQFDIAGGKRIDDLRPIKKGYAMEVRINAECAILRGDSRIEMRPVPGQVETCVFPEVPQIEVILAIGAGKTVSPFYDSMVAQVIAFGSDRDHVIRRLIEYLSQVEIKGISTNIPLLLRILNDQIFVAGKYDTGYLDQLMARIQGADFVAEMEAFSGTENRLDLLALKIEGSDEVKVISPGAGTIFLTPSPSEPPLVSEGDIIDVNTPLCQIEAMKVFTSLSLSSFNQGKNPIYPPAYKYRVNRIQYGNGSQVNSGDLLFVVMPLAAEAMKAG